MKRVACYIIEGGLLDPFFLPLQYSKLLWCCWLTVWCEGRVCIVFFFFLFLSPLLCSREQDNNKWMNEWDEGGSDVLVKRLMRSCRYKYELVQCVSVFWCVSMYTLKKGKESQGLSVLISWRGSRESARHRRSNINLYKNRLPSRAKERERERERERARGCYRKCAALGFINSSPLHFSKHFRCTQWDVCIRFEIFNLFFFPEWKRLDKFRKFSFFLSFVCGFDRIKQ